VPRVPPRGRPAADPTCAGCAQLGIFRALRRAGLDVQGGSGCDDPVDRPFAASPGRWAAVTGARRLLGGGALQQAAAAGARLLVLADRDGAEARAAAALLAATGAAVVALDAGDLGRAEAAAREASLAPGAALVALTPCARGARRSAPFSVAPARCNRCGACLSLGCPAISDPGGEAMVVDAAVCTGCGRCAPLCRARALAR
jgi:TPP-dependent indolepyruvate ferredoxin oxidoreductase alpha subunit